MGFGIGGRAASKVSSIVAGADDDLVDRPFGPQRETLGFLQRHAIRAAIGLGLGALFIWLLLQRLDELDLTAMQVAAGQLGWAAWAGAVALTCLGFWAVGQYDVVLHRHFATGVDPSTARRAGISAIAISQTLGLGVVTGAILRWRMLPDCSLWLATRLTVSVAVSFLAGWALVTAGVVLAFGPAPYFWPAMAVLALLPVLIALCILRPAAPWQWPNLLTIAALIGLCAVDTLAAAAALMVLLPADAAVPLVTLLPAFLIAYGAGLLSGTPGGIGAFELTLLALLPSHAAQEVLVAVLAWRLVYFVLPAIVGAAIAIWGPVPSRTSALAAVDGLETHSNTQSWAQGASVAGPAEMGLMGQGQHRLMALGEGAQIVSARGHVLVGLFDPLARPRNGAGADGRTSGAQQAIWPKPAQTARRALQGLAHSAAATGRWAVHYKGSAVLAAAARAQGWRVWRISREAVLDLADYDLASPARAALRRKLRRAEGAGVTQAYCSAADLPKEDLAAIAAIWAARNGGERGFSMGQFDLAYLTGQRVYLAHHRGQVVAFVSFHTQGADPSGGCLWTLDLVRHCPELPDGTMHALINAAIFDAMAKGVVQVSLAAVPEHAFEPCKQGRKGAERRRLAPLARRTALRLARRLGIDTGQGLRQFKDSFAPKWQARYLCAPHRAAQVVGALSIWRAVHFAPLLPAPLAQSQISCAKGQGAVGRDNRFALLSQIWHARR